jgi:hypothetical protein
MVHGMFAISFASFAESKQLPRAIDMAKQFPHAAVIGFDLNPAKPESVCGPVSPSVTF